MSLVRVVSSWRQMCLFTVGNCSSVHPCNVFYKVNTRFLPTSHPRYARLASTQANANKSSRAWIFTACLVLAGGAGLAYYRLKIGKAKKLLMSKPLKERILSAQKEIKNGNYQEGYKLYHAALEISSYPQSRPADKNKQAFITDQIANLAFTMGNYLEAEDMFKRTMKMMIASGTPQDDNAMIEISLKLSNIYESRGMDKAAEIGYKWCVTTAEKNCNGLEYSPDSNALLGMAQESLGVFYYHRQNFKKAKEYLESALTTAKRTVGSDNPQVAVIHNHLNLVYLESKDYEAAEAHIKLAIENGKLQDDKSQLAVYLVNYGFLHLKKGDITQATNCLEQVKELNDIHPSEELSQNIKKLDMAINGEFNE